MELSWFTVTLFDWFEYQLLIVPFTAHATVQWSHFHAQIVPTFPAPLKQCN